MIPHALRPAALAAGFVFLAGCGGPPAPAPVTGTLTLGGKPLARVTVTLVPESIGGAALNGSSDDQGAFALLPPAEQAITAGSYKVVVVDPNAKGKAGRADDAYITDQKGAANPPVPAKYGRPETTTARVTVEAGKPVAVDLAP